MSGRRCHIVFFDGGLKSEDGFLLPDGSIVSSPPEKDIVVDKAPPSTIQPCGLPGINHSRKLSFHEKQEYNCHQSKRVSTIRKKNKKRKDTMGGEKGVIAPVISAPTFIGYSLPPPELMQFVDAPPAPILALSQEMLDTYSDGSDWEY